MRVALAADFASPFANAGEQGLGYINSDVTLYLHRLPVKEWIGFEVVNHHATDGIAIGECWLYDQQGAIGTSTVAALAQRKPMPPITRAPSVGRHAPRRRGIAAFQRPREYNRYVTAYWIVRFRGR